MNAAAQRIVDFLKAKKMATRWELSKDCFGGHLTKAKLDAALDELLQSNPPVVKVDSVPRPKGSPGSATKIYKLCGAKSAKSAKSEHPCGLARDLGLREVCEVLRSNPPDDDFQPPDFADLAHFAEHQNQPLDRMDIETSHTSHTSHGETDFTWISPEDSHEGSEGSNVLNGESSESSGSVESSATTDSDEF